jgi:hypothetical protein
LLPQRQLSFKVGDLLLGVNQLFIALGQLLLESFHLTAQALVFTFQLSRFCRLQSAMLAVRCPQTSTLPGFSTNSQVQTTDY